MDSVDLVDVVDARLESAASRDGVALPGPPSEGEFKVPSSRFKELGGSTFLLGCVQSPNP